MLGAQATSLTQSVCCSKVSSNFQELSFSENLQYLDMGIGERIGGSMLSILGRGVYPDIFTIGIIILDSNEQ